jgi:hypothetical protein
MFFMQIQPPIYLNHNGPHPSVFAKKGTMESGRCVMGHSET